MHRFGLECYLEEDSEQGMLVMDGRWNEQVSISTSCYVKMGQIAV